MPSYGGVGLVQPTPEIIEHVARNIPLEDVLQFRHAPRLTKLNINLPSIHDWRQRRIKLGSLWWPTGAARWAVGSFLATESQLTAIRALLVNAAGAGEYQALEFVLDDDTSSISTDLWMLPPRPLAQMPADDAGYLNWYLPQADFGTDGEPVYLLTLVDERYFWWDRTSSIAITENTTTWEEVISSIGSALGVTITPDTVAAAYLKPPVELESYNDYLPLLLDLVCYSIGHRFLRQLDGTCVTQTAATAKESQDAQIALGYSRLAGGQFAFDVGNYNP